MSKSAQAPVGVVTSLQGRASVLPAGNLPPQALKVGDAVQLGDKIMAADGAQLEITDASGATWAPRDVQIAMADQAHAPHAHQASGKAMAVKGKTAIDNAIDAVDRGDEDAATAAGLTGGGADASMGEGLRVDRVIEVVTPQEFAYGTGERFAGTPVALGAIQDTTVAAPVGNRAPVVTDPGNPNFKPSSGNYSYTIKEDTSVSGQVKATDPDGDPLTYAKGSDPQNGTAVVNKDGSYTYTPNKDYNGSDSFTITVSDGKGGTAVTRVDIGITPVNDTPTINDPNYDPVVGGYVATTKENTPVSGQVKGSDVDGDKLTYAKGSDPAHGMVVINADGTWDYTPDSNYHGSDTFTVTVTDPSGATVTATVLVQVASVVDTPTIKAITDDVGSVQGAIANGGITDDNKPTVSGTGEAGSTIQVYDKGTLIGTTTVGNDGKWSFTPTTPLSEGEHSVTVVATDGAGSTSAPTTPQTFTVDVTAPNAPSIGGLLDDVGAVQGQIANGSTTDDAKPTLSGTAEAGSTVHVLDNGKDIGSAVADANGNWSFTPTLPLLQGEHSLTAVAVDAAGNTSAPSAARTFTLVGDGAPAAPAIDNVLDDVGAVQGNVAKGSGVTDDTNPTIKGTAEPGVSVKVFDGATLIGTTTAAADGTWSITPATPLADGLHNITASATNAAGNTSPTTGVYAITVDTHAPDAPTAIQLSDDVAPKTGSINNGETTDDATPTISGKGEPGATITVLDNGQPIGTATVQPDGSWSLTPTTPLVDGAHTITTTATDAAGNTSPASTPVSFTLDTSGVTSPTITTVTDDVGSVQGAVAKDGVSDDTKPTIAGTAPAGTTVTVYDGTTVLGTTTADASGKWTFTPSADLAEGPHSFTATATNAAGVVSAPTPAYGLTIDTHAPDAPKIGAINDDVGSVQGPIAEGATTDDKTPTVTGSGEPGATIKVYDGGSLIGTATVGNDGTWSMTPATPLNEGAHTITVTATDAAGNTSAPSPAQTFIIDMVAPNAPSIGGLLDDVGAVQGQIANGSTTDDAKPTLSGTAEAGSTVHVLDNGKDIGSAVADANGNWSFTPTLPLLQGEHSLTAVAVDAAGNTSAPSAARTFTLVGDGAPAAPAIDNVLDDVGAVQGNVAKGSGVTDDTNPTIKGTAEPGVTVKVFDGATLIGTTTAAADGTWSVTPATPLADGLHNITASATNAAGNTSPTTGVYAITVDTHAPDAPTAIQLSDDVAPKTGSINSGDTTDDATPTISGKGEPGATVTVLDNGQPIGTATVGSDGAWSLTPTTPLVDGAHTITTTATDAAGNTSPASTPVSFTLDTSGVTTPTITTVTDDVGSVQGAVAKDGVSDDTKPTIAGTAPAGTTVTVYDGTTVLGTTTADASGKWSLTPSADLAEGPHSFTATATNAAGVVSAPTPAYGLTIDTHAPDAPKIGAINDDVGSVQGPIAEGATTDDKTPTVTGSGEPGATIKVYDGGSLIGTATVGNDGTWSMTPATPLNEGAHSITVTATDAAGNTSAPSPAQTFIIDTVAPNAPSIGGLLDDVGAVQGQIANGSTTDDAKPTLSGTAEAGSTVHVLDNGKDIGSAVADANGNWSFTPTLPLLQGEHSLTAVAVDAAGNTSAPSAARTFTLVGDGAPAAPAIDNVLDDVGAVQGNVAKGSGVTDDTNPTIKGTAEPGVSVKVFDGATLIGTTTAAADGTWSITPATPLADGLHNITASATNAAGNTSPTTGVYAITVDTHAPDAPTAIQLSDDVAPKTGSINNGETTDDATPTISGKGEPGATITVLDNGQPIGTATVQPDGSWSLTPTTPLVDGAHTITTTATDAAGNTSPASTPVSFTLDTSGVTSPTITTVTDDVGSVQGAVAKDGVSDDTKPTIAGTAPAGTTVTVYDGTTVLGTTTADASGKWTFTPSADLAEGPHSFTATATNAAGVVSAPTPAYGLTIDTHAPDAPKIGAINDDVGSVQGPIAEGATTDDKTPTVTGSGEPGATIKVYDGGSLIGTATVGNDGTWSMTPATPLNEGAHTITVTATDAAGNTSAPSPAQTFIIDMVAPNAPSIGGLLDDVGAVQGQIANGSTTDDAKPTLSGTAEAGSTVHVLDNGKDIGSAVADANGNWSFTPTLPLLQGEHSLTAVAVDAAGNTSAPSAARTFTLVGDGAPAAPAIDNVLDDVGAVQGNVAKGSGVTDDTNPTIKGTAEPGVTVKVFDGATLIGTTTAAADGTWSVTPATPLADGLHNITASATNAAGNTSPTTGVYAITVDTHAPDAPTAIQLSDDVAPKTGSINSGDTTDDATPTISGKGEPGATVTVLDNGQPIGTATVGSDGAWSLTPTTPLVDGAHTITTTATDAAGNTSPASTPVSFTLDTSGVTTPTITTVTDDVGSVQGAVAKDGVSDDTKPTIAGTAPAGTTVTVYDGATVLGTTTADASGKWSLTPSADLAEGPHSFTATATNAAGVVSAPTPAYGLTIDTHAPNTPAITSVTDDVGSKQGAIANGATTDDKTPTLNGTAEAGATVKVYDNGSLIGTTTANAQGQWSLTPATPLNEGAHSFAVTATDAAGNTSAPSAKADIVVDVTPPATPTITSLLDDVGAVKGQIANGSTTDDAKPTLSGTGEAGSTIDVYDGKTLIGTTTVSANGTWTLTPSTPLTDGAHNLTAISSDAAGNTSAASEARNFTVSGNGLVAVDDEVSVSIGNLQGGNYYVDSCGYLGKLDPATGANVVIGYTGQVFGDIAMAPNGTLYGVSLAGVLFSINPETGASTQIGATGLCVYTLASDASGHLYAAATDGKLYTLSTTTGAATKAGTLSGESTIGDIMVVGNTVYESTSAGHLVKIDLTTGKTAVVANIPCDCYSLTQGAEGHIYAITSAGRVYDVNLATGGSTDTGRTICVGASIYGTTSEVVNTTVQANIANFYTDSSGNLGKLDPATGVMLTIGRTGQVFGDITQTGDGKLYGVTLDGRLYSIDPVTAASKYIGASGVGFIAMANDANGQLFAGSADGGLYKVSATTGAATKVGSFGEPSAGDILIIGNNAYESSSCGHLIKLDMTTGKTSVVTNIPCDCYSLTPGVDGHVYAITSVGAVYDINLSTGVSIATGTTLDVHAAIYGTTSNFSSTSVATTIANYYVDSCGHLGKLDPTTGAHYQIGDTGRVFGDVAATSSGKLYGVTLDGQLYSINPNTAASTLIGKSGICLYSMASDANGQLYAGGGDGSLYKLSTTTGAATKVGTFGTCSIGDILIIGNTAYESNSEGHLVKMDLTTGKTTVMANIPCDSYSLTVGAEGHIYAVTSAGHVYDVNLSTGVTEDTGKVINVGASIYGMTSEVPIASSWHTSGHITGDVTSGAAGQDHDASGSPFSVSGIAAGDLTSANGGLDTTVHGQYGNLVMHADGTYTYDIDANAAATIALNNGSAAFGKDVFTYTITNDVGQSSSATLTVDVSNANNTVVLGGQGNNALSGHGSSDYGHADVFKWSLADAGEAGKAAVDTITNFNNASASSGGDVLDLRDLLQGETSANLTNYLHFEKSGADTIVHVSSNGGFASGYQPGAEDQKIIVTGFDLTAGHTSDATVIANLMAQSKLLVDH